MDKHLATLLLPERPIQRIGLHELYRRSCSYSHHQPSTSAEFEFCHVGEINSGSSVHGNWGARVPGLGHYRSESIDPDEEVSEVGDYETCESDDDDETTVRAVSVSNGAANDAKRGKLKSRTSTKAGKRPVRVGKERKERKALAWLKRVLNLIHMLSLYTTICASADGVFTQLQEERLSTNFKRGIVWLYTQLKTGALAHTTLLNRLFGPIIGASNVVHAPFRAHSKRVLESAACRNFPFKNFTEYMKSEVKKRLPEPDYKSLLPLPREQTDSLFASPSDPPPNGPTPLDRPPPDRPTPSKDSAPAQTETSDDPPLCSPTQWDPFPNTDLQDTNDLLQSGIWLADAILDRKAVKTLLPHRRLRLIRDSRIMENVRPHRKQSVGWVAFRIARNMMGQGTHYQALASHPFQSNHVLRAVWEETQNVCVATRSGEEKEVRRYARLHAARTIRAIILDRKLMKTDGERMDSLIVKMGGCRRLADAASWISLPKG